MTDTSAITSLSAAELDAAIRLTPATLATKLSRGKWIAAPHLRYIALRIASAVRRGNGRLIISIPPRHGKSQECSIWTPVWALDEWPEMNIMLSSYSSDLSTGFSRVVRDTIIDDSKSEEPFLRCQVRPDTRQVDDWRTTAGGAMYSIGIGGAMTGRGADLMIIDDYLKNNIESESQTVRDNIWDWWLSTAQTRLEPNATVIIIATRWNPDDLTGRILENEPDQWEEILMPAIEFSPEEAARIPGYVNVTGRQPGEALWADRYDVQTLLKRKASLGSYWFNALYQQNPHSRKSGNAKLDKVVATADVPSKLRLARGWDLAATQGSGDYTVGGLIGLEPNYGYNYIVDLIRTQASPAQVDDLLRGTAELDGADVPIIIEQEPGASGKAYAEHLITLLKGFTVIFIPPSGSKFVRASPFLAACENGRVLLHKAFWNKDFMTELFAFPDGPNDDQIDAVALGFNYLHKRRFGGPVWGRESTASPQATGTDNVVRFSPRSRITSPIWGGRK